MKILLNALDIFLILVIALSLARILLEKKKIKLSAEYSRLVKKHSDTVAEVYRKIFVSEDITGLLTVVIALSVIIMGFVNNFLT